jgi:hypothetical protein
MAMKKRVPAIDLGEERAMQRAIDQTIRKINDPRRADRIQYNRIKNEQSKWDVGGRARTDGRFKAQAKKAEKKFDTKRMVKSATIKKYTERKGG